MIGAQIRIAGEVSGDEDVEISGRVEGTINLKRSLVISPAATVEAKIHAKTVTIAGKVKGDVSADERVELLASGTLDGNIRAPKIVIAEGAQFRGNVDMSGRSDAKVEVARPALPAPTPADKK